MRFPNEFSNNKEFSILDVGLLESHDFVPNRQKLRYLNEQRLPEIMLKLRESVNADVNNSGSGEHQNDSDLSDKDCMSDDETRKKCEDFQRCPLEVGDLQITSLGKIVKDSDNFQNDRFIWPEGYTAMRMFPSITDPSLDTLYKMEVLRDTDSRSKPLFRVTAENGEA